MMRPGHGRGLDLPRRSPETRPTERPQQDEHGRVLRDNVFGTQEEDARRRDFTVNALYYDPATEEVVDFHGGLADLKKRMMRIIGDPETRYREDPVRMLRAVRLAAQARPDPRRRDARADPRDGAADRARAAGAPVRRDAEAAAVGPRQRLPAPAARGGPAQGPAAAARRDPRAAARRALRHAGAGADRRARARRPAGVARVPVRRAALARGAGRLEGARDARRARRSRRSSRRWTRCSTRRATSSRSPRRSTATMREVWAMQPRFEQRSRPPRLPPARAAALPHGLRFPRAARGERRGARRAGGLVARASRAPTPTAARAMLLPDTGPRKRRRRRRAQGRRRAAAGVRARAARDASPTSASGSNLGEPKSQVRLALDELAGCPDTAVVKRSSLYRTGAGRLRRPARFRQRRGADRDQPAGQPPARRAAGDRGAARPRAQLPQRAAHPRPRPPAVRRASP